MTSAPGRAPMRFRRAESSSSIASRTAFATSDGRAIASGAPSRSARAKSAIVAKRASASFAIARAIAASIACGASGARLDAGAGASVSTRSIVSALVLAAEEPRAGERLPRDDPHREDVGPRVDRLAAHVLGRHVPELPLERPLGRRLRARLGALREPEVGDARDAVDADEDVLRRHVAMHESEPLSRVVGELVERLEPGARVEHDAERDP